MTFLLQLIVGILLDWTLGEPSRFHPLMGFGTLADRIDRTFPEESLWRNKVSGLIVVVTLVGLITLLVWWLISWPVTGMITGIIFFYFTLGGRSLFEHARDVQNALNAEDLKAARVAVGRMVSRDTSAMDRTEVSLATIESVLENGNDAVFGTIFWFVLLGAPGAVCYRLINTLDAMWGYRTAQYSEFGWAAARLDDLLNWIPARLCALTYSLVGETKTALICWKKQAAAWESPNAGPVIAAGAGALQIQLGGPGVYHGLIKARPVLGTGRVPVPEDIQRALWLVQYGVMLWLLVIALIVVGRQLSLA